MPVADPDGVLAVLRASCKKADRYEAIRPCPGSGMPPSATATALRDELIRCMPTVETIADSVESGRSHHIEGGDWLSPFEPLRRATLRAIGILEQGERISIGCSVQSGRSSPPWVMS